MMQPVQVAYIIKRQAEEHPSPPPPRLVFLAALCVIKHTWIVKKVVHFVSSLCFTLWRIKSTPRPAEYQGSRALKPLHSWRGQKKDGSRNPKPYLRRQKISAPYSAWCCYSFAWVADRVDLFIKYIRPTRWTAPALHVCLRRRGEDICECAPSSTQPPSAPMWMWCNSLTMEISKEEKLF